MWLPQPPTHVELIELTVQVCCASNAENYKCMADMINIGFFFFSYTDNHMVTFDNKPFKLSNTLFYQDNKHVPIQTIKLLHSADF